MGAIGIITIIVAVGIVLGVAIASIVRKVKGKPSLGCDCAGCAHAKECSGNCSCCSQEGSADWKELVENRKQELENQSQSNEDDTCECCKHSQTSAVDNNNQ